MKPLHPLEQVLPEPGAPRPRRPPPKAAAGAPLRELLVSLLRLVETQIEEAAGAILLLDPGSQELRHAAAPRLPECFTHALDGIVAGEGAAACGTAAFRRQPVVSEDVATDPLWEGFRDLAAAHRLRACWSTPILDAQRQVLGTLDLYFREPRRPGERDRRLLDRAVDAAGVAISARREEEEALARRELLRDLVENSQDLICTHDLTGRILSVNRAAERMTGFSRDEFLRMSIVDLLAPEARGGFGAYLDELRATGEARGIMRVRTAAGETRYWEYNNSLRREGLQVPLVRGLARDVTERVLAENALAKTQEHLQRAVKAANVGLWDWDLRTNELYLSPEFKHQIGYEDHELASTLEEVRSRFHPADHELILDAMQTSLDPPYPPYAVEFRFRHRDGSYRHILARGALLRDEDGQPLRLLGSHADVTDRAQLEAELRHAQKMESVGRLAGGLAHDFNNLLTVICGTAELATRDLPTDDPLRARFQEIHDAGERAAELTRQLLAFSRKQILQPVTLNLNTVISDMGTMLRRLIGEDVELNFLPAADLGPVRADAGQIEQVLMNLAVNARDAMPDGGRLTIETRNAEVLDHPLHGQAPVPPGLYVALTITDTGVGMDEAVRERIFEPFFTTKEPGKGTGLGLSTVYGIVRQSGGGLAVESSPGAGSTFTMLLPCVEAEAVEEARPASRAPLPRGGETVLVVEDEGALRRLTQAALESAGYRVLTVANGREALRLLEDQRLAVRLVLTDMVMPEMGGRELAQRLAGQRPEIKILFTSGYDDALSRHGATADGAHFIAKPFSIHELARKVREVLDTAS